MNKNNYESRNYLKEELKKTKSEYEYYINMLQKIIFSLAKTKELREQLREQTEEIDRKKVSKGYSLNR